MNTQDSQDSNNATKINELTVEKVNFWVKMDIGTSMQPFENLSSDLEKFCEFDQYDMSNIHHIKILSIVE